MLEHKRNPEGYYKTLAPCKGLGLQAKAMITGQIWEQVGGTVTYFVAAASTDGLPVYLHLICAGGTVCGCGRYLKEMDPLIQVLMPDPVRSVFKGLLDKKVTSVSDDCGQSSSLTPKRRCALRRWTLRCRSSRSRTFLKELRLPPCNQLLEYFVLE
jgi:hypothetical protein